MDLATLIAAMAGGISGAALLRLRRAGARIGMVDATLAGLVGGLVGGQVLERSMQLPAPAPGAAAVDPGLILAAAGGGVLGGLVLVAVIGCLQRVFSR